MAFLFCTVLFRLLINCGNALSIIISKQFTNISIDIKQCLGFDKYVGKSIT